MRQFAWFDCLRCAAIFLVLLAHVSVFHGIVAGPFVPVAAFFEFFQTNGWIGVDLFFVLSGFLVSGLLFDEHDRTGTLDIGRFYIRRGFKIIPPFYVLVLATVFYDACLRGRVNLTHLVHDLLFLQSYRAGAWPHAWTLALEVHFYLLLGLLLVFLARRSGGRGAWLSPLPRILVGTLIVCFFARWIHSALRHGHFNYHSEIEPSHLHLDVLAAGVLLRFLFRYHARVLDAMRHSPLAWIGLGLVLVAPSQFLWTPHPALVTALIPVGNYLGFGLIVFQAAQLPFPAGAWRWVVGPFDYLGKHSYSIYLWHLPVKEWLIDPLIKDHGFIYLGCYFAGSLAVGIFFSEILEMPVLRLRNRLFPSKNAAQKATTATARSIPPATDLG